jgi:hypothetical protein
MSQTFLLEKGSDLRASVLANAHQFLDRLPATKSWRLEIKEARKERTDLQNDALFGVAYLVLMQQTGYTKDEMHEAFCKRFFGTVEREVFGSVSTRPYRTTTTNERGERDVMEAVDFGYFYDMVQQVGAEAGVFVPDPDPMFKIKGRWSPP